MLKWPWPMRWNAYCWMNSSRPLELKSISWNLDSLRSAMKSEAGERSKKLLGMFYFFLLSWCVAFMGSVNSQEILEFQILVPVLVSVIGSPRCSSCRQRKILGPLYRCHAASGVRICHIWLHKLPSLENSLPWRLHILSSWGVWELRRMSFPGVFTVVGWPKALVDNICSLKMQWQHRWTLQAEIMCCPMGPGLSRDGDCEQLALWYYSCSSTHIKTLCTS